MPGQPQQRRAGSPRVVGDPPRCGQGRRDDRPQRPLLRAVQASHAAAAGRPPWPLGERQGRGTEARLMRLTPGQLETLRALGNGLGRADNDALALELLGLCVTGTGRFGSWARITDAGRQHLDRMSGERSRRASPRQVLAAPAPKAAASTSPGGGSRAGSAPAAGTPCVVRHDVSTPLPRTVSTPERRKPVASQDRASSPTRTRAQAHKVAPPAMSSARPLPSTRKSR